MLQANVQRGSRVYERGHLLVLAWAEAQRDQEVIWKVLSQVRGLCAAAPCDAHAQLSVSCSMVQHHGLLRGSYPLGRQRNQEVIWKVLSQVRMSVQPAPAMRMPNCLFHAA